MTDPRRSIEDLIRDTDPDALAEVLATPAAKEALSDWATAIDAKRQAALALGDAQDSARGELDGLT